MDERKMENRVNLLILCLFAMGVGLVTGLGSVVFRAAVAFVHNLFILGEFSFFYDANEYTPASPWGAAFILSPVIGGLIVVFLVKTFAPEARGHGVPEVIDSIYYKGGEIRPVVALIKTVASAVSIGSGASVGREGPIIQIGATLGSTIGQLFKLAASQRITLLAAGAGAGIASTFNTPLGAVMFAVELMLPEISTRTFLPVVLATGTATYIGRLFFGMQPAFFVPAAFEKSMAPMELSTLSAFIALGLVCGLIAYIIIKLFPWMDTKFSETFKNPYLRSVVGMTMVGCLLYFLFVQYGHYYVEGVSYGAMQEILKGEMTDFTLLAILFLAKLVATPLSLAAGASGGVFAPSLFIGTTAGAAFAAGLAFFAPEYSTYIPEFAMVGMASVLGGATGGAMMAIMMVFEMTLDYNIILPVIIAVAVAVGLRRFLLNESIYTVSLLKRGHKIPTDQHTNMYLVSHARDIMDDNIAVLPAETSVADALALLRGEENHTHVVVTRGNRLGGVVTLGSLLKGSKGDQPEGTLDDVANHNFVLVREDDFVRDVFARLKKRLGRSVALVVRGNGVPRADSVCGVISKAEIADSVLSSFQH